MIIPPWLNFDPNEAARLRIQAAGQRNQMAVAGLNAQLARERLDQETAQQNAALQYKYQELSDMMAYRQEESERRRSEGEALERLRQQKYEQDALQASIRAEGMRDYQDALSRGEQPASAFARNAHKLLYSSPAAMERFVQNLGETGDLSESQTQQGAHYLGRPGGRPYFIPQNSLPEDMSGPRLAEVAPGLRMVKTGPNSWGFVNRPVAEGGLTDMEKAELTKNMRERMYYLGELKGATPADLKANPRLKEAADAVEGLEETRKEILDTARNRYRNAASDPVAKATLANRLAQEHPDWTRQEVIDEVNRLTNKR